VGEEDPYAARLTGKLGAGHVVINVGEIGWSSFQGLRLLREHRPALVLLDVQEQQERQAHIVVLLALLDEDDPFEY
jgi:hypothetical protein